MLDEAMGSVLCQVAPRIERVVGQITNFSLLAGIFPYISLSALGFVCVTGIALTRRDWMLKWLAGTGRWAQLLLFMVLLLVVMLQVPH